MSYNFHETIGYSMTGHMILLILKTVYWSRSYCLPVTGSYSILHMSSHVITTCCISCVSPKAISSDIESEWCFRSTQVSAQKLLTLSVYSMSSVYWGFCTSAAILQVHIISASVSVISTSLSSFRLSIIIGFIVLLTLEVSLKFIFYFCTKFVLPN